MPSPTQNLGQVSLGRAQVFRLHTSMGGQAQVFENLGRGWASLCSVETAIVDCFQLYETMKGRMDRKI